ncbi:hypothetical protein V502_02048 [Pseudogymnoascus sp. VKM F-4520 (FW-2644)]|nr:hypothetical protein V502_02048 [Pseudogymnoascus sp. VKM F-4520 (FW-2644)]
MRHATGLFLLASIFCLVKARPSLFKTSPPKLTLPWGTWAGIPYGEHGDVVHFKNVRFGRAPIDDLRFAAPQYPEAIRDRNKVQDSSYGPNCIQAKATADYVTPEPLADGPQSEDCLFLDVYVPSWALEPDAEKLPVVVWIFGGAYIFGAKGGDIELPSGTFSPYDGQGFRDATDNGLIWVTGNYRLGAFGFLAGTTMEEEAQPNAGLHDQRLLLDWVQRYIGQVGGDKHAVNAWGLSAGAGSIVHHLTAYGGTKDEAPLFHRAALWSTAFQWSYDRKGSLEDKFLDFTEEADCPRDAAGALECLRNADPDTLNAANQAIVSRNLALGMFPFGPAVDGDLVPELPAALLKKGKHVYCSSLVLSHNFDEASMFLAKWVETKEDFTEFVRLAFPGDELGEVRKSIAEKYPPIAFDYNQKQRLRTVLRDSTFVCNKRQVYNAYKSTSTVYTARFEIPPAQHGTDLLAIIWNRSVDIKALVKDLLPKIADWIPNLLEAIWVPMATRYQVYFAGHALSGDPNYLSNKGLNWEVTTDDGEELTNSLKIGLQYSTPRQKFFALGRDFQTSEDNCAFWDDVAETISGLEGNEARPLGFNVQRPEQAWAELK